MPHRSEDRIAPAEVLPARWELAAENIAVQIRWLGLFFGYLYVNTSADEPHHLALNAILGLGAVYTLIDTYFSTRGRVFLGRYPLLVSTMEALFIGLLCYYHGGPSGRFHYYYFLSLICCAIRHPTSVTYATCGLHMLSVTALFAAQPSERRDPFDWVLMLLVLVWVTWAVSAMARLLKRISDILEQRVAERTRELQDAQAQLLHQEKMAAFGLLAAGIAHEVGNPLASVSSILQILRHKLAADEYARDKLHLADGEVRRIQSILRELINFSRPARADPETLSLGSVIEEALSIAKYYPGFKSRKVTVDVPKDLPLLHGVRGQLVQVFLNLVLNAVDATAKGGRIDLVARTENGRLLVQIGDDGHGIDAGQMANLFQPYFTTKKHGTGLGLFVSRKLLRANGGTIGCESRPGHTLFTVTIPTCP